MTMEDLTNVESNPSPDDFDARLREVGTLIEELARVDPAAAAEPAAAVAELLSGMLETEDRDPGA